MNGNDYELERLAGLRLAELRTVAAHQALAATLAPRAAGRGLRGRVGRGLVRLGHLVEGRRRVASRLA